VILLAGPIAVVLAFVLSWRLRRFWPGAVVGVVVLVAVWASGFFLVGEDEDQAVALFVAGWVALFFAGAAIVAAVVGSQLSRRPS
jgi:4-hydroxybenzoate polyprenyltransferase